MRTAKKKKPTGGSPKVGIQKPKVLKTLGIKEAYFAVNTNMVAVDNLEKEIVKLSHGGSIQQLREKREELQWCRNSLEAAQMKLAELSRTLVAFMCEAGLVLYKGKQWTFGFDEVIEVNGKTPEEAVAKFMEKLG
jgi:intracellular sulfur oxidation DsrE/DsrF family protein